MKAVGPTEVRVRAALLRLFERCGEEQFSWPSEEVRDEVLRDEPELDKWRMLEGVQRVGRRIAKGATDFSRGKWCELEDDIDCTYERGTFTVRRRGSDKMPWGTDETPERDEQTAGYIDIIHKRECPPKLDDDSEAMQHLMATRKGQLRTFGFLTVDWTGDLVEVRSIPAGNVPKVLREWADRMNADATRERLLADRDPSPPSHLVAKPCPFDEPTDVKEFDWFEDARERGQVLEVKGGRARVRWEQISESVDWRSIADLRRNYTHIPDDAGPAEPRLTQRHLDLMRHATGGKVNGHRNYYCAASETPSHEGWVELVGMGLAGNGEPPDASNAGANSGRVFHVTAAGYRMTYGREPKARKRAKR